MSAFEQSEKGKLFIMIVSLIQMESKGNKQEN